MKFLINNNDFKEGLKTVSMAIPKRTTMDILKGVKIETLDEAVRISGFDLDIYIQIDVPANVFDEGVVIIPFTELNGFVSKATKPIKVTAAKDSVTLLSTGKIRLNTFPLHEYPQSPSVPEKYDGMVFNLKDKLKKTLFLSTPELYNYSSGILFGNNKVIATDGVCKVGFVSCDFKMEPVLVSSKLLYNLFSWENAHIGKAGKRICFKNEEGNIMASGQEINFKFPNFESLIPSDFLLNMKINREALLNVCETSAAINKKTFIIKIERDEIGFEAASERGVFTETIPLKESNIETMTMWFNPQNLVNVLKNIEDEEVVFRVNAPDKSVVVSSENYIFLTMPQAPKLIPY